MAGTARGLKIGTIIERTLAVLELNWLPALIYLLALGGINAGIAWYVLEMPPLQQLAMSLLAFLVGVIAIYFLLEAMLRRLGLIVRGPREMFYPFLWLTVLYTLGYLLGLILIVLPGLFVMARWSIAQPLLLARGGAATRALGESWEQTRGNEFAILIAALVMVLPLIALAIAGVWLFEATDPVRMVLTQVASTGSGVVIAAMAVALYDLIVARHAETFS